MSFRNNFKSRLGEIRNRLTHIGKTEPLSILSLIFIGLLDIFVFFTIQSGIYAQVEQLTSPVEYIPYTCRNIVVDDKWVEDNYIEKIAGESLYYNYARTALKEANGEHPICQRLTAGLVQTRANKTLVKLFKDRQALDEKYHAYDLYQKQSFPEAKQIQLTLRELDNNIAGYQEIKTMLSIIKDSQAKAAELAEDERQARFVYPLKVFAMQMMFLLPLFFIFYMWNAVSIKKDKSIQAFLSAHMLVIAFIPIMFRLGDLLLEIIPRRFLEKLMQLLESLNLIGLWSYFVIAAAIAMTLLIIYIVQKKLFTKEKLVLKRVTKGQCIECGLKMPLDVSCCPYCGCKQKIECSSCYAQTLRGVPFCLVCGSATVNSDKE